MESRGVVTLEAVQRYQQKHGAMQTQACLQKLGMLQQFYNARNLPVGMELLDDINDELIRLGLKVLTDPESTADDKAMFRAYSSIGQKWAKRIDAYEKIVKDINGAAD